MLSFSGTGVLPAILVMIRLCDTFGTVSSRFISAAAPKQAVTPGQVSYATYKADMASNDSDTLDEDTVADYIKALKKLYVVEISMCDNEIDFNLLTQEEYISRYGCERWEE